MVWISIWNIDLSKKNLNYGDYLQLDKLLNAQSPKSKEAGNEVHDEMLFIIIHQAYELWFKQIQHELDSIISMFKGNYVQEENIGVVVARLDRIKEIQKLASVRSELLSPAVTNTKVSFTVGNWALPYLNLLKQLGIMK